MSRYQKVRVLIMTAGYHEERAAMTRLYVENRISFPAAIAAFELGRKMRSAGVPCLCSECRSANPKEATS